MGSSHDWNAAFLLDQRSCISAGPLVAGDIDAVGRGSGIDDALGNGCNMGRSDVLELLEYHIFSVIGDDCEAACTQEPERRLMQFLRVGAQYYDIAHAEMRERADSGANAGGRGQSGRVGDQLDDFLFE